MTAHAALTARELLERDFEALRIAALDAADAALDQAPTDAGAAFDARFDPLAKRFLERAPLADKVLWRSRIATLRDRRHARLNAAQAAARGARRRARLAETDALALQAVAREADPQATDAIIEARRAAYAAAAAAGALRPETAQAAGDAFAAAARREVALAQAMAGFAPSLEGLKPPDRAAVKAATARASARREGRQTAEAVAAEQGSRQHTLDALAYDAAPPEEGVRTDAAQAGLGAALKAAEAVRAEGLGRSPGRLDAVIEKPASGAVGRRRSLAARAIRAHLRSDPLDAAAAAGVIDPPGALDPTVDLVAALTRRAQAAAVARVWVGAPNAPMLTTKDRAALRALWVSAPDARAAVLDALGAAPRLERARIALAFAGDAPVLGAAIALAADGAAEVLRALAAVPEELEDDAPDLGPLSAGWRVLLAGRAAADRGAGLSDGGAAAARRALLGSDIAIRGVTLPAAAPGVRADDLDAALLAFGAGALEAAGVEPARAGSAAKTGVPGFVAPGVVLIRDETGALADRFDQPALIDLTALLRGAAA